MDKPVLLAFAGGDGIHSAESDELARMWNVFSKCKTSLQEGRRLENLSWRLWHQSCFAHPLPPASESPPPNKRHHLADHLSDPEGGCSESSGSDGSSPPPSYTSSYATPRRRSPSLHHGSNDSSSSAPTSRSIRGLSPSRMSPKSLKTLIHKVLEPAELVELPKLISQSLQSPASDMRKATSVPAAEVQPPDSRPSEAIDMQTEPQDSMEQDSAAASYKSRVSEGSITSSRGHARRVVHHVHGHGLGHSRARQTSAALRRNLSERALAAKHADVAGLAMTAAVPPAASTQPSRPALPRQSSSGTSNSEKQVKTVRIAEDASPAMERTSSRERPSHHRRSSSTTSMRSNGRSSQASLTSLEPQSVTRGFGAGSVTSLTSTSPASAGPFSATSPSKASALRNSVTFKPPSPASRRNSSKLERKEAGKSRMFFVGSEQAEEEVDGDSSSGWGSDPDDGEAAAIKPELEKMTVPVPPVRTSQLELEPNMFAKRPVKSAADLASAAALSESDIPRTASQGLLTALFSADPYALARQSQRPADRAAALMPSRSAVSLPARRLGGPPPDVELSDDEDEEKHVSTDATQAPRAYNISNAAARAVVPPPLQLSASQTRRNMLTTELSESLRRNLLWERQSQPGARDRRIVDRRAASQTHQPVVRTTPQVAPASVAVDTTNFYANQYHRQGW